MMLSDAVSKGKLTAQSSERPQVETLIFFLDTRFIRTPEKTPTTPLIERGAKTPGKRERTNLPN